MGGILVIQSRKRPRAELLNVSALEIPTLPTQGFPFQGCKHLWRCGSVVERLVLEKSENIGHNVPLPPSDLFEMPRSFFDGFSQPKKFKTKKLFTIFWTAGCWVCVHNYYFFFVDSVLYCIYQLFLSLSSVKIWKLEFWIEKKNNSKNWKQLSLRNTHTHWGVIEQNCKTETDKLKGNWVGSCFLLTCWLHAAQGRRCSLSDVEHSHGSTWSWNSMPLRQHCVRRRWLGGPNSKSSSTSAQE